MRLNTPPDMITRAVAHLRWDEPRCAGRPYGRFYIDAEGEGRRTLPDIACVGCARRIAGLDVAPVAQHRTSGVIWMRHTEPGTECEHAMNHWQHLTEPREAIRDLPSTVKRHILADEQDPETGKPASHTGPRQGGYAIAPTPKATPAPTPAPTASPRLAAAERVARAVLAAPPAPTAAPTQAGGDIDWARRYIEKWGDREELTPATANYLRLARRLVAQEGQSA